MRQSNGKKRSSETSVGKAIEIQAIDIHLRNGQTLKEEALQDSSVKVLAPLWVEDAVKALFKNVGPINATIRECTADRKSFRDPFTKVFGEGKTAALDGDKITLQQLLMLSRNEGVNTSGEIAFDQYREVLSKKQIYALKDLVRHCVIVSREKATHTGGFGRVSREEISPPQDTYVADLSALQFQKAYNSGRLVLIAPDGKPLPKGTLDDTIFQNTVGEVKADYKTCEQDRTGRYVKLETGRIPGPYAESYFDTVAYQRFVAQDYVLSATALNAAAKQNSDQLNFRFLSYGTGFFTEGIESQKGLVQKNIFYGVKQGLEELFRGDSAAYSQIKRVAFPFYSDGNCTPEEKQQIAQIKKEIITLCQQHKIEAVFSNEDALKPSENENLKTAVTNCSDPHAFTGNEMGDEKGPAPSVDAMVARNIERELNNFNPALNEAMTQEYISVISAETPLLLAIDSGKYRAASQYLGQHGKSLDINKEFTIRLSSNREITGVTLLSKAICKLGGGLNEAEQSDLLDLIKGLLEIKGIDTNIKDSGNNTPLQWFLLNYPNVRNEQYAAQVKNILGLLLAKTDLAVKDNNSGQTAVHIAAQSKCAPFFDLFVNYQKPEDAEAAKQKEKEEKEEEEEEEVEEVEVENGGLLELLKIEDKNGVTAFARLMEVNPSEFLSTKTLAALIGAADKELINAKDEDRLTPLRHAIKHGDGPLVLAFMNYSHIKALDKDDSGKTALHYAAIDRAGDTFKKQAEDLVGVLMNNVYGQFSNQSHKETLKSVTDNSGRTPLHYAAEGIANEKQYGSFVKFLRAFKDNKNIINAADKNGDTALHLLIKGFSKERPKQTTHQRNAARELIKAGASLMQENGRGVTPHDLLGRYTQERAPSNNSGLVSGVYKLFGNRELAEDKTFREMCKKEVAGKSSVKYVPEPELKSEKMEEGAKEKNETTPTNAHRFLGKREEPETGEFKKESAASNVGSLDNDSEGLTEGEVAPRHGSNAP